MTQTSQPLYPITLFFDGSCQLCSSEIRNLKLRDTEGRLAFIDCSAPGFTGGPAPRAALMDAIHSVDASGHVHVGVQTFRLAYAAVGMSWVSRVLDWPLVGPWAERAYPVLVRNRYRLPRWLVSGLFERAAQRAEQAEQRSRACHGGACAINHDEGER